MILENILSMYNLFITYFNKKLFKYLYLAYFFLIIQEVFSTRMIVIILKI